MKTIKDITQALKEATKIEPWMQEIAQDERIGVIKAWTQFQKRLEKAAKIQAAHTEKLDGILIATTNLCDNLDSAFDRRFLFKIRFVLSAAHHGVGSGHASH